MKAPMGKKLTKVEMMEAHNLTHSQVARIIFLERIPNESERAGQRSMTGVYDYDLFLAGLAKRKPAPLCRQGIRTVPKELDWASDDEIVTNLRKRGLSIVRIAKISKISLIKVTQIIARLENGKE